MDPNNTNKPESVVPESNSSPKIGDPVASIAQQIPEPTTSAPAIQSAVASTEPTVPQAATTPNETPVEAMGYKETKSNKLLYIFVFVLVVIFLSLVGLFFYKQYLNTTADSNPPTVQPTVAASPSISPATEEESELNQIEVPNLDQELQDVQKDTEQL